MTIDKKNDEDEQEEEKEERTTPYPHWDHLPIDSLVQASEGYCVFLRKNLAVDWETTEEFDKASRFPDTWGAILNRCGALESSLREEVEARCKVTLARMLAEGVARGLEGEPNEAHKIHDKAEAYALERNREIVRLRNLQTSGKVAGGIIGTVAALSAVAGFFGWLGEVSPVALFHYVLCAGAGATGALLSTLRHLGTPADPQGHPELLRVESAARIFVGTIGAVFAVLCLQSGVIQLGAECRSLPALLVLSLVAGSSERLVPELINRLDGSATKAMSQTAALIAPTKQPKAKRLPPAKKPKGSDASKPTL